MRRFALLLLPALAGAPACGPSRAAAVPAPAPVEQRSLTGWFHVVWGDSAHFWLIDDGQQWTELVLDPGLRLSAGAAQGLDGRRVRVAGEMLGPTPPRLRVTFLEPLSP